jgi:thiol-disulfide isomerase/thioredoxin
MRKLFTAFTLLGFVTAAASAADDKGQKKADSSKEKESKTLKAGDAAPQLKVTKWLQGKEVPAFTQGKVYVVEFWATWCGPCVVMMPHLGELQSEYKDQGVTVIGYTANDENNTADKVAEFVSKRGPKLGYTFAYGADRNTYDAWMTAAGQNGIPCSFVIDQKGKIAYIGHPMFLGEVLPKVVAGTWNAEEGAAVVAEAEKDLNTLFEKLDGPDAAASLKALQEFEKKRPGLASIPFLVSPKIMLLLKAKKFDEATKFGGTVLAKAIEQEDTNTLRAVANMNRLAESKGEKSVSDLSLKASDALLKASGDKDLLALVTAAEVNFSAGNTAKAKEFGKKAMEAAADQPDGVRKQVERLVKRYDEEKKEDGKKEEKK